MSASIENDPTHVLHKSNSFEFDLVEKTFQRLEAKNWRKTLLKDRTWRFRKYPSCATGQGITKYLIGVGEAATVEQAVNLGRSLLRAGVLSHVVGEHDFENAYLFYHIFSPEERRSNLGSKSALFRISIQDAIKLCRERSNSQSLPPPPFNRISFSGQRLTDQDVKAFLDAYTQIYPFLTYLDLHDNPTLTNLSLDYLATFFASDTDITGLDISDNIGFSLEAIKKFLSRLGSSNFTINTLFVGSVMQPKVVEQLDTFLSKNWALVGDLTAGCTVIDLSQRKLSSIPSSLEKILWPYGTSITSLDLSENMLTESIFAQLYFVSASLNRLRLSDNQLKTIPNTILNFPELKFLDVSNNQIEWVSERISWLPHLDTLDLSGNRKLTFDMIPSALFIHPTLQHMPLSALTKSADDTELLSAHRQVYRTGVCDVCTFFCYGERVSGKSLFLAALLPETNRIGRRSTIAPSSSSSSSFSFAPSASGSLVYSQQYVKNTFREGYLGASSSPGRSSNDSPGSSKGYPYSSIIELSTFPLPPPISCFWPDKGIFFVTISLESSLRSIGLYLKDWKCLLAPRAQLSLKVIFVLTHLDSRLGKESFAEKHRFCQKALEIMLPADAKIRTYLFAVSSVTMEGIPELLSFLKSLRFLPSRLEYTSTLPPEYLIPYKYPLSFPLLRNMVEVRDDLPPIMTVAQFTALLQPYLAPDASNNVGPVHEFFQSCGDYLLISLTPGVQHMVSVSWINTALLSSIFAFSTLRGQGDTLFSKETFLEQLKIDGELADFAIEFLVQIDLLLRVPPQAHPPAKSLLTYPSRWFNLSPEQSIALITPTPFFGLMPSISISLEYAFVGRIYQYYWYAPTFLSRLVCKMVSGVSVVPRSRIVISDSWKYGFRMLLLPSDPQQTPTLIQLSTQRSLHLLILKITPTLSPSDCFAFFFSFQTLLESFPDIPKSSYCICPCSTAVESFSDMTFNFSSPVTSPVASPPESPAVSPSTSPQPMRDRSSTKSPTRARRLDAFYPSDRPVSPPPSGSTTTVSLVESPVLSPINSPVGSPRQFPSHISALASDPMASEPGFVLPSGYAVPPPNLTPAGTMSNGTTSMTSFYSFASMEEIKPHWTLMHNPSAISNITSMSSYEISLQLYRFLPIRDRTYFFKVYKACFVASEAVTILLSLSVGLSRVDAVDIFQRMVDDGYIIHVVDPKKRFADDYLFFRFTTDNSVQIGGGTVDLSTLLEIAQLEIKTTENTVQNQIYPNSFTGTQAVNWLTTREMTCSRVEAVRLFNLLIFQQQIAACIDSSFPFADDETLYYFRNTFDIPRLVISTDKYSLFSVVALETRIASNQLFISCDRCSPDSSTLAISSIAPDLTFLHSLEVFDPQSITSPVILGSGSFGQVFQARFEGPQGTRNVVLKKLQPDAQAVHSFDFVKLRQECWVLQRCSGCPFIIAFFGVSWIDNSFTLMMELMNYGDLFSFINRTASEEVNFLLRVKLCLDIARGLRFLHLLQPPLVHNDLKSPNVLLSSTTSRIRAKICDFDMSHALAFTPSLPKKFQVDNPIWTAPEETVSLASDIYSLAIIFWEVFNWIQPFRDIRFMYQISQQVQEGLRPNFVVELPTKLMRLIQRCWHANPQERYSASRIIRKLKLFES